MRALPLAGGLTWLVLVGLACAEPVDPVRRAPHLRLTSLFHAGAPPLHGVGADFRPVLEAFPATRLLDQSVQLDDSRRLDLELELPARLAREERLVIEVHASPPTVGAPSRPVGAVLVRPEADPSLRVALPLGEDFPEARELLLRVDARRPPGVRTTLETPEVEIPAGATLELATGLMSDARGQGAARFTVLACRGDGDDDCRELLDTKHAARGGTPTWRDHRAALGGLAGERVRLRFETSQPGGDGFAFPLWGNPTVLVPDEASPPAPNLILISLDTLRADRLGSYGYARDTTPSLDAFAARSVVFEDVLAQFPRTLESHRSLFSARYPFREKGAPVLAEVLRAAGYRTAGFTGGGYVHSRFGFARGFERYEHEMPKGGLEGVAPRVVRWLEEGGSEPFFLFVHTYDVHCPYAPPKPWAGHFSGDHVPGFDPTRECGVQLRGRALPPEDLGFVSDSYDDNLRWTDAMIGELLDEIEGLGLLENTIVAVVSDHGEALGEGGHLGHGRLSPAELQVPWILRAPGLPPARVEAPVELVDVTPTLLGLLDVEPPPDLDGRDLGGLLRGDAPEARRRIAMNRNGDLALRVDRRWQILLRRQDGRRELRDLAGNPQRDLAALRPAELARASAALDDWLAERGDELADVVFPEAPNGLAPDHAEQLRQLGYVE